MYDICAIGHITNDKVVTKESVNFMPGGTAFYFSNALKNLNVNFVLVTAIADAEKYITDRLQHDGIKVVALPSRQTVFFENIYGQNQDHREQNVLETADPFSNALMPAIEATIYHLGPLLNSDIPVEMIEALAKKAIVSVDVQGYLRTVHDKKVFFLDWVDKKKALPYISILKANEFEMEILTGTTDIMEGAKIIAGYGVKEVIITSGSKGSLIYHEDKFYDIPAFKPTGIIDATGCGDTYMAGYLYQKIKRNSIIAAGSFGAAMATLKIQSSGPFNGNEDAVNALLRGRSH